MIDQTTIMALRQRLQKCRRNDTINIIYRILMERVTAPAGNSCPRTMPTVCRLAEQLGVARQSVRKAYELLEAKRQIKRMPGGRTWYVVSKTTDSIPMIAVILPTMFSNYYLPSTEYGQRHIGIFSGMMDCAMEAGYLLVPMQLPSPGAAPHEVEEVLKQLKEKYCGVIHVGERGYHDDPPLAALVNCPEIPQVSIDCEFEPSWVEAVTFDPEQLARITVNYLRENGHRRIGIIYHRAEWAQRNPACDYMMICRKSIFDYFRNNPIAFERIFELRSEDHRFGPEFEQQILKVIRLPDAPSAFWCRDDLSAMELIKVLKRHGYSVPTDFSVIGFDDIPAAALFDPPLTTLRNPIYELGYTAIRHLIETVEGSPEKHKRTTRLVPILCVRKSVSTAKPFFEIR